MDLLDSIMSKMAKPPSVDEKQRKMMKEQQRAMEAARVKDREQLSKFRKEVEEYVDAFIKDTNKSKLQMSPMDQVARSVVRDVAEVAGLTSYTFGVEGEDRHVMLFKKEYEIDERELQAYREGREWCPLEAERAQARLAEERADEDFRQQLEEQRRRQQNARSGGGSKGGGGAHPKFLDKIERIVGGKQTGKNAAKSITADNGRQFGFVTAEHKKDKRTIEQTLNDIKAKKQKINQTKLDELNSNEELN